MTLGSADVKSALGIRAPKPQLDRTAASGIIEVLALPQSGGSAHLFDARPPQGAFMVIEVDQVEARYQRAVEKRLPIQEALKEQAWGHRSFCVRDPNGLTLYFFSERKGARA
jgi:hypothetical protein